MMFHHMHLLVRHTEKPHLLDDLFRFYFPRLYWRTLELSLSVGTLDLHQRQVIQVLSWDALVCVLVSSYELNRVESWSYPNL